VTTLKTPSPDVLEYLQAVRSTLADLPPDERDELMVDVETALFEAAEESERPLAARLGPPEDFAADLRAAAGLQDRAVGPAAPAAARLHDVLAAALAHPRVARVRTLGHDLAPIWWLVRGFVAFAAVAMVFGARTSVKNTWMPVVVDRATTLTVLALITGISVWLGLRRRDARGMRSANVALALVALPLALVLGTRGEPYGYEVYGDGAASAYAAPSTGLALDGRPILNIYPYSRDGRLLHDVALFDDAGRPLTVGTAQPDQNRRVLTTRFIGRPVFNTFPILYFEPGTTRVAHPDATAVPIRAPRLSAAPLRSGARQP
jgi:uncharacterized membrane protein